MSRIQDYAETTLAFVLVGVIWFVLIRENRVRLYWTGGPIPSPSVHVLPAHSEKEELGSDE